MSYIKPYFLKTYDYRKGPRILLVFPLHWTRILASFRMIHIKLLCLSWLIFPVFINSFISADSWYLNIWIYIYTYLIHTCYKKVSLKLFDWVLLFLFLIFWPRHPACGILVPNLGSDLHQECRVLTTGYQGSLWLFSFTNNETLKVQNCTCICIYECVFTHTHNNSILQT